MAGGDAIIAENMKKLDIRLPFDLRWLYSNLAGRNSPTVINIGVQ